MQKESANWAIDNFSIFFGAYNSGDVEVCMFEHRDHEAHDLRSLWEWPLPAANFSILGPLRANLT